MHAGFLAVWDSRFGRSVRDSLSRETDEPAARRSPGRPPLEEIINLRHPLVRLAGALVVNPRTGRAIDDVTLRLRFPEEIVPGQGQGIAHPWDLALGRRAWDAGAKPLGLRLGSAVLFAHDADLRAADVDASQSFPAL